MEMELLEQIAEDERDLAFALGVYGGDLARLKASLLWQVNEGLIEIQEANRVRPLTGSELKALWCDDANFLDAARAANYQIRLTDKGARQAFG